MSGYFARVAAMALGGPATLRPASATRFGARAFDESAAELLGQTEAPRGMREREHERTGASEPVRDDDGDRVDAARRRGPPATPAETSLARPDDERGDTRGDALGVVRTPPAQPSARDERRAAHDERTPGLRSAALVNDADPAVASRRLMPLDDVAAYDDSHAPVRAVPRQHGDGMPPEPGRARRRANAGLERRDAGDAHADADVYVHIGRIDVRAVAAPERRPTPPPRAELRKPSLEAHLRARDAGRT